MQAQATYPLFKPTFFNPISIAQRAYAPHPSPPQPREQRVTVLGGRRCSQLAAFSRRDLDWREPAFRGCVLGCGRELS